MSWEAPEPPGIQFYNETYFAATLGTLVTWLWGELSRYAAAWRGNCFVLIDVFAAGAQVGAKVWKVDINARQNATLMLTSVSLRGGVQRRRTQEDQLNMRSILSEGDLVSADVHSFHQDGGTVLHARSVKYGKLSNGILLKVSPNLVPRQQHHFVTLPCGVDAVLGNNGFVWLTATYTTDGQSASEVTIHEQAEVGVVEAVEARKAAAAARVIGADARRALVRIGNCVKALAANDCLITPTTIMATYTVSEQLKLEAKALLQPSVAAEVVDAARPHFG